MLYDDGSGPDACYCDGADDATYTCEYHLEHPEGYSYASYAVHRQPVYDLVDAYGPGHYKTGVYDEYRAVTVVADELAGGLYDARDWS